MNIVVKLTRNPRKFVDFFICDDLFEGGGYGGGSYGGSYGGGGRNFGSSYSNGGGK